MDTTVRSSDASLLSINNLLCANDFHDAAYLLASKVPYTLGVSCQAQLIMDRINYMLDFLIQLFPVPRVIFGE